MVVHAKWLVQRILVSVQQVILVPPVPSHQVFVQQSNVWMVVVVSIMEHLLYAVVQSVIRVIVVNISTNAIQHHPVCMVEHVYRYWTVIPVNVPLVEQGPHANYYPIIHVPVVTHVWTVERVLSYQAHQVRAVHVQRILRVADVNKVCQRFIWRVYSFFRLLNSYITIDNHHHNVIFIHLNNYVWIIIVIHIHSSSNRIVDVLQYNQCTLCLWWYFTCMSGLQCLLCTRNWIFWYSMSSDLSKNL